ncbi:MAG: hypothetical protein HY096_12615 [Nitrospinae bacterium]|nr:hypothetical protein [Nitrospinota bacterium]
MVEKMWEILTTLTEEAQNAALAKCKELGFDTNRGIVSLEESFINLNSARSILMDAIEKKKLIQLPISIQKTLFDYLGGISRSLTGLVNGTDEVINLTNAIEQLNTAIWQYGFYNLSKDMLGYLDKMNQLKNQELEVKKLKEKLEDGLTIRNGLESLLNDVKKAMETIQTNVASSEEIMKKGVECTNQATETARKITETFTVIQQTEKNAKDYVTSISATNEKVEAWATEIDKLAKKSEELRTNINQQEKELNTIIGRTEETHKQVESLLPGAASAGLASAFLQRKKEIAESKKYWIAAFICSLLGLLVMVIWMIKIFPEQRGNTDWWIFFLQRAPLSFPLIWLGWFFGRNYGHIVRLEEDYAFKESISRSFEGYKKQMQEVSPEGSLPQLCNNTISILSEPPLRVFDRKTSDETPANSLLDRFMPKKQSKESE